MAASIEHRRLADWEVLPTSADTTRWRSAPEQCEGVATAAVMAAFLATIVLVLIGAVREEARSAAAAVASPAPTIQELQSMLDAASPHTVIDFAHSAPTTTDTPLRITKPVKIRGLQLQQAPGQFLTPLLVVQSPEVSVTGSRFVANGAAIQGVQPSLIEVSVGDFSLSDSAVEIGPIKGGAEKAPVEGIAFVAGHDVY